MKSTPAIMINQSETPQQLEDAVIRLDTLIETFTNVGSGWTINQLGNVTLHIGDYDVIGGSNYIASPKWIELKKATVNIKNKDNLCFAYCMLAASHPQKANLDRVSHYNSYLNELNVEGLTFPIEIGQIPIFESNNPDYSINVICTDSDDDQTFV